MYKYFFLLQEASSKQQLPKLDTIPGTEIRFSKIPRHYPEGATPSEITKYSMDSTFALQTMIDISYRKKENSLLGEIQFSFICFLVGQVYDAFDQWKKLVHLMCSSVEALNSFTDLYMNFISVLHFQVQEIPEDFFVDIVSTNNFLTSTLQEFFSNLEDGNGDSRLKQRGLKFRDHLTRKFKWDFTTEPDEYAPVIVETVWCHFSIDLIYSNLQSTSLSKLFCLVFILNENFQLWLIRWLETICCHYYSNSDNKWFLIILSICVVSKFDLNIKFRGQIWSYPFL